MLISRCHIQSDVLRAGDVFRKCAPWWADSIGEYGLANEVLIVDDDPAILALLKLHLSKAGYKPILASSGEQGLDFIGQGDVQLVIADWHMPGISGEELCRQIRSRSQGRQLHVIVL